MPYPTKIDRQSVADAALAIVEREGEEALTLRRVAAEVGVTANAIYRYFDSRDALVAATANAAAHRLYIAIDKGLSELPGDETVKNRVRKLFALHSDFAEKNPALWRTIHNLKPETGADLPEPHYHKLLWDRSLSIIGPLVRPEDGPAATLSVWAQLHGLWSLRQLGVIGGTKPAEIDDFAFDALLRGLSG
ncbi:MAG TPA: TetR/AcrR family transcriptional regulator [Rhodanobacter sp.]